MGADTVFERVILKGLSKDDKIKVMQRVDKSLTDMSKVLAKLKDGSTTSIPNDLKLELDKLSRGIDQARAIHDQAKAAVKEITPRITEVQELGERLRTHARVMKGLIEISDALIEDAQRPLNKDGAEAKPNGQAHG